MDKKELYVLLSKTEKQAERAKLKRAITTILAYAVAIFLILYFVEKPTGIDILGNFIFSLFLSGINFVINGAVFGHLYRVSEAERSRTEELKNQVSKLENTVP